MRDLVCADALLWLAAERGQHSAIVTSLPDAEEIGLRVSLDPDRDDYGIWFDRAASAVLASLRDPGVAIFYQTDRRIDGGLYSKTARLDHAARLGGLRLLRREIVLRRDVGKTDLYRPGYSTVSYYGTRRTSAGRSTPDVHPRSWSVYENGSDVCATERAVIFASRYSGYVLDPFCGRGTTLAVADELGLDSIGVDVDPEQIERARELWIGGL